MPRGRKTSLTITLTADERQTLIAWQRSGMTVTEVAQRVGMTRRSVSMWARRFLQHGIAGLADKPGRRRRRLPPQPDRT